MVTATEQSTSMSAVLQRTTNNALFMSAMGWACVVNVISLKGPSLIACKLNIYNRGIGVDLKSDCEIIVL